MKNEEKRVYELRERSSGCASRLARIASQAAARGFYDLPAAARNVLPLDLVPLMFHDVPIGEIKRIVDWQHLKLASHAAPWVLHTNFIRWTSTSDLMRMLGGETIKTSSGFNPVNDDKGHIRRNKSEQLAGRIKDTIEEMDADSVQYDTVAAILIMRLHKVGL